MSDKSLFTALASFWKMRSSKGVPFYASNRMTMGELRNTLKEFKEENEVSDTDNISLLLFKVDSENKKAPALRVVIKKDEYKKGD